MVARRLAIAFGAVDWWVWSWVFMDAKAVFMEVISSLRVSETSSRKKVQFGWRWWRIGVRRVVFQLWGPVVGVLWLPWWRQKVRKSVSVYWGMLVELRVWI